MATNKKNMTDAELRQHLIGGFSITGMAFAEVADILNKEGQKLPPAIFNKVRPVIYEWSQGIISREDEYIIADVENNEPEKKRLREQQFLSDMNVVDTLIYYGASHIVEKMQAEAVKHTLPNSAGQKFNMFHAVQHDAIYYPNDVELLHRQGFNFDREQVINGKPVDFTQYNIDTLDTENASFEKNVDNLIKTFQKVNTQRNALIEQYQKLEQEKQTASARRQRAINREIEQINQEYQKVMQPITHYRVNAEADMQDFISCRQRLLKAVELNCVSPENIQKIQNVDMDSKVQRLQTNYIFFKRATDLLDGVSANNPEQQHIANAKPFTDLEAQNNTLANAANNEPVDKKNIQAVQKQQLGATINLENEDLVMHQTQQATKF